MPKSAKYKEWPQRKVFLGFYIPDCEPRVIPEGAHVHESVLKRMAVEPGYRPVNLPKDYVTVPMPVRPHAEMAETPETERVRGAAQSSSGEAAARQHSADVVAVKAKVSP